MTGVQTCALPIWIDLSATSKAAEDIAAKVVEFHGRDSLEVELVVERAPFRLRVVDAEGLPIAGAKGSGLSLMIELLTGVMSGNPVIADALLDKDGRHRQNGLVIAIDVARFGSLEGFRREVERLAGAIHGLPPSDADAPVRLPGERGSALAARRQVEGVPLPPPLVKTLKDIAAKRGVAFPDPR